jgi:hypothetical protein
VASELNGRRCLAVCCVAKTVLFSICTVPIHALQPNHILMLDLRHRVNLTLLGGATADTQTHGSAPPCMHPMIDARRTRVRTTCLMVSAVTPISFFLRHLSATFSPVASSTPRRTLGHITHDATSQQRDIRQSTCQPATKAALCIRAARVCGRELTWRSRPDRASRA